MLKSQAVFAPCRWPGGLAEQSCGLFHGLKRMQRAEREGKGGNYVLFLEKASKAPFLGDHFLLPLFFPLFSYSFL